MEHIYLEVQSCINMSNFKNISYIDIGTSLETAIGVTKYKLEARCQNRTKLENSDIESKSEPMNPANDGLVSGSTELYSPKY